MSSKSCITKIITDEPTEEAEEDALDFKNYSQKLAEIIENSIPRFAIGVFGGWGTGKTSLMEMTKKTLDNSINSTKFVTVWFDAWRYEREENLAVIPFLRTIKLTIEASEKSKEGKWEGVKNSIKRSAGAFITSTKVTYGVKDVISAETDFEQVAKSLKGEGDTDNIYYYVTQFLEKADLREHDKKYRIVVFIDDLDRCGPDKALEVLESIKSFFDIEGIIYVIGIDSETINSLVNKKYGKESAVEGLYYLQKIVQLPFHIPTWKEVDISSSITKIISRGLEGSRLAEEFENNKNLIVKAVELNPRQVKRFINNIILAESVFGKPVDELIAVQALNFRHEWWNFLDLLTLNDDRRKLIFRELIKQGNSLREFLDAGAQDILERIEKMEEHRRALDTAKLPEPIEELQESHIDLVKLLQEGKVQQFNELRIAQKSMSPNLLGANLLGANLSHADLSGARLLDARLSDANLSHADLSDANLSHADLSDANLSHADLSDADLSFDALISTAKTSALVTAKSITETMPARI